MDLFYAKFLPSTDSHSSLIHRLNHRRVEEERIEATVEEEEEVDVWACGKQLRKRDAAY